MLDRMNAGTCLICETPFEPFISFGRQPIANAFLPPEQFDSEYFYELTVGKCPRCHMVQLGETVDPSRLFHETYAFFSGTSKGMSTHFAEFAEQVKRSHLRAADPFVVEIGSNDGIMLRHFARSGLRHLGIEPSANVAAAAAEQGIRTISRFFDEELAREILHDDGPADVILGANVICHIPDLQSVVRGVKALLKRDGAFIFEDPYMGDIVEKVSFDQFYDEHVFYFSTIALDHLFRMNGMEIVDLERQPVHGGEVRYTARNRGAGPVSPAVSAMLDREREMGLDRPATFEELRRRIEASRDALTALLRSLRGSGHRIVGYGATSKSTTVTNYCGIGPDLVEYISDTTPIKQGRYSPGTHIPVRPYSEFQKDPPEYALLFAWNHAQEILAKERDLTSKGVRFIVYVPKVGFVP